MNELLSKISQLEQAFDELDPTSAEREEWHAQLRSHTDDFLGQLDQMPGYNGTKNKFTLGISGEQGSLSAALNAFMEQVVPAGINPASAAHLGYIPGGGIYASALADYLASITNEYAGVYYGSPGAVTVEEEVLNWMKDLFNFPETAVGNLTSGGSIANLIALTSARDQKNIKGSSIEKSVIYMSAHTHHCMHKALRIIGLESVIIRDLLLDQHHRVDSDALERQIQKDLHQGLRPAVLIGTAGTTDTGAIDPLDKLADLCEAHNMWFHIDAAYGGFFMLLDEIKPKFKGIERADSLVIDPHKGLFLPYGVGAVLVRNKEAVLYSHHYTANYMQDTLDPEVPISPAELSPELTKHFRGLRVWLPLRVHGVAPFKACLEQKLLLTRYFREQLAKRGFELGPEPELSVSYFRMPKDSPSETDVFNRKLMQAIHNDGDVFLSSTLIDGKFVIRMAILAFRTKKHTIDRALAMIDRCLDQIA